MTTYILGAGASAHAGYPLASQLGKALLNWIRTTPGYQYASAIHQVLSPYGDETSDFEKIVTDLECPAQDSPLAAFDEPERKKLSIKLRDAVCKFFSTIHGTKPATLYRKLAQEKLKNQDLVITLNYDVALDLELKKASHWEASDGYGFDTKMEGVPKPKVQVLKLHGSTNWVIKNGFGDRPIIDDLQLLGYPLGVQDPQLNGEYVLTGSAVTMLGKNKQFYVWTGHARAWEDFYDRLFDHARAALRRAHDIVLIGYSLPEADLRARAMILGEANRDSNVTICCRKDSDRIKRQFGLHGFRYTRVVEQFEDLFQT